VPDMGVRVAFLESRDATAAEAPRPQARGVMIPDAAIVQREGGSVVFVAVDDRAAMRKVEVGAQQGTMRNVLSGIQSGDRVIVDPPAELKDGNPITEEKRG
jgi:hypothetical protein